MPDLRSRRTQVVLASILAITGVIFVLWQPWAKLSLDQRASARLSALTPLLPSDIEPSKVLTHPECEAYPPCSSAAQTWSPPDGSLSMLQLTRTLATWAPHNGLRRVGDEWTCGHHEGPFGSSEAGCDAAFMTTSSDDVYFVSITFAHLPKVPNYPTAKQDSALPTLGHEELATATVQVVVSSR